jgi:hypothetical protein
VLGADYPNTLWTSHGLAMSRRNLGDVEGARQEFDDIVEARWRLLSGDHPDTL